MRVLAVSMLLILAEASASACPVGTACVASETRSSGPASSSKEHDRGPAPRSDELARQSPMRERSAMLLGHAFARIAPPARDPLAHSLRTHVAPRTRSAQVHALWGVMRRRVYAKLPTYQHRGISLMLSPVVVETPSATVPGLGVGGAF